MNAKPRPRSRDRRRLVGLLLVPAVVFLVVVYVVPFANLLLLSFHHPEWSLESYRSIAHNAFLWDVLLSTLSLAGGTTLICLVLGYPVAYLMARSGPRLQKILAILIIVPLWTNLLVRMYAWIIVLGRKGAINIGLDHLGIISDPLPLLYNRAAVYVGMVHVMIPLMILPIFAVMRQVDFGLVNAARSLGASPFTALIWVFFPLTLPGVSAGCLLVFVLSVAFYVTPAILGGEMDVTYVLAIDREVNVLLNWPLASAMAAVLLLVVLVVIILYQRFLGFGITGGSGPGTLARGTWLLRGFASILALASRGANVVLPRRGKNRFILPPALGTIARHVSGWAVVVFIVGPILIVFPLAFTSTSYMVFPPVGFSSRWFETYFTSAAWIQPTVLSFQVAIITALIALPLGLISAVAMVRAQFVGKSFMLGFLISPLIVPVIILAIALYFAFAPLHLVGTVAGLVLAHVVLALPLVVIMLSGALQAIDEDLERAARSLGAGPVRAFLLVTLPMMIPAFVTAGFFAFLISFDEVVIALFLTGPGTTTLPRQLWEAVRFDVKPTIAAVSTLLILLSIVLLLVSEGVRAWLGRKRTTRTANEPSMVASRT